MKSFLQAHLDQLSCANNHSPQSHVLFFARKVGSSERKNFIPIAIWRKFALQNTHTVLTP